MLFFYTCNFFSDMFSLYWTFQHNIDLYVHEFIVGVVNVVYFDNRINPILYICRRGAMETWTIKNLRNPPKKWRHGCRTLIQSETSTQAQSNCVTNSFICKYISCYYTPNQFKISSPSCRVTNSVRYRYKICNRISNKLKISTQHKIIV